MKKSFPILTTLLSLQIEHQAREILKVDKVWPPGARLCPSSEAVPLFLASVVGMSHPHGVDVHTDTLTRDA